MRSITKRLCRFFVLISLGFPGWAGACDQHGVNAHDHTVSAADSGDVSHGGMHGGAQPYRVEVADYQAPEVKVMLHNQQGVAFNELFSGDEPVLMQFIFTSCSTICPIMAHTFAAASKILKAQAIKYRMVSVSIDPEFDSPEKLADYARQLNADQGWSFVTGTVENIRMIQKAFDYTLPSNNKMYHRPLTFAYLPKQKKWLRIEGLQSAESLARELVTD